MRIVPTWSGAPASDKIVALIGGTANSFAGGLRVNVYDNAGVNVAVRKSDDNETLFAGGTSAAQSWTAFTATEIMVTCDGARLYVSKDGVEILDVAVSDTTGVTSHLSGVLAGRILLGPYSSSYLIDEVNIWDTCEAHVYAARSAYVTCDDYDGTSHAAPAAGELKHGVVHQSVVGTYRGANFWESLPAARIQTGFSQLQDGATISGSLLVGTPPSAVDVRFGTTFIDNLGATLTGSLVVPTEFVGVASCVNFAQIKENLRYIFTQGNTITAQFDLSNNLSPRVRKIASKNPGRLPMQASEYPYVSMYVDSKDIELKDMAANQKQAKRHHMIRLKIVGGVWNAKVPDKTKDAADDTCEILMENIEETLRRDPTLAGACLWHTPSGVTYHNKAMDEEAHLRVGILSLDIMVMT